MSDAVSIDSEVLRLIERLARLPEPESPRSDDGFMEAGVAAMSELLGLAKISCSIARPSKRGYSKRNAPAIGLFVRATKLAEGAVQEICEHRAELADVFYRPFLETIAYFLYLLQSGPESTKSFIRTSYRPEREMLDFLTERARKHPPTAIEKRMLSSIRRHLRDAGIPHKELRARKNWKLDGKSSRDLMKDLDWDLQYIFGFAGASHSVHPSWCELIRRHLTRDGRAYLPDISYAEPDLRALSPFAINLAGATGDLLRHFKLDPHEILEPISEEIFVYFRDLDAAHEKLLQERDA